MMVIVYYDEPDQASRPGTADGNADEDLVI